MERYTRLFKSLSDPTRLRIMRLLIGAEDELCICELIDVLGIPQYNASKHMKELKYAGLAKERKEGRFVFYSPLESLDTASKQVLRAVKDMDIKQFREDLGRLKNRTKLGLRICRKCAV